MVSAAALLLIFDILHNVTGVYCDLQKIESGCNCFDIPVWPPGMLMKYNEVSSSDYFANG